MPPSPPPDPPVPLLPSPPGPNTTAEEDKHTLVARRINMIWEITQAAIAASTIGTALYVSAVIALSVLTQTDPSQSLTSAASIAYMLISNMSSLVIGFYFGRTNHARQGGVITPQTPGTTPD